MPYEAPKFLGRFQAWSPFQSEESLGSRRGRPLDSYPELIRDRLALDAHNSTIDVSGQSVSADDAPDVDSDYGAYDPSGD